MIDFRLFFPKISLDEPAQQRRPVLGHSAQRVYQLPADRRVPRQVRRR